MNVYFVTLGCKVNTYETNSIKKDLNDNGYNVVDDINLADIFVINSCSVTNQASKKSRQMISKCKEINKNGIVCLLGCYVEVEKKLEELNCEIILGNSNKIDLVKYLKEYQGKKIIVKDDILEKKKFEFTKVSIFDHTRAFLKIQDGCNQFCSYCIIPYTRGDIRSKDVNQVIEELNDITNKGYKEVVLAGIHTGKYFSNDINLSKLIKLILEKVPRLKRLRLSSIEINEIDDELLELIKTSDIITTNFHLPLQSGSNKILKLMNRPYTKEEYKAKIDKLKALNKDISISTDIIVGFPYEDENDFLETYNFAKEIGFLKIHVFPFSKREGTVAATYKDMDMSIKKERVKKLTDLSALLTHSFINKYLNKELDVLFERNKDGYYTGYSKNYIKVLVKSEDDLVNQIQRVLITDIFDDYVIGKVIE